MRKLLQSRRIRSRMIRTCSRARIQGKGPFSREHVARVAHAADRRHRFRQNAADEGRWSTQRRTVTAGLEDRDQCHAPLGPAQRSARPSEGRVRQRGDQSRTRRSKVRRGRGGDLIASPRRRQRPGAGDRLPAKTHPGQQQQPHSHSDIAEFDQ